MSKSHFLQQLVVIMLIMIGAFYIQELPTSSALQITLPEWPFIFALYFSVSMRYFFGVFSAFIVGIVQDVFLGMPIGLHAIIYVICAFILIFNRMRFRHSSLIFQSLTIGVLVLFKLIITFVVCAILYSTPSHLWSMLSIPLSILVWPNIQFFFNFFANRHNFTQ